MEALQKLFGDKSLTWDEFNKALTENEKTIKLANLRDGEYVGKLKYEEALKDSEKKLAEITTQLDEAKKVASPNEELTKQIEALTVEKGELEKKQAESSSQLNLLHKRELAREKTGIVHTDFLDLMVNRHGDKSDDDFVKAVTEHAEANKDLWKSAPSGSPNLDGKPQGGDEKDAQTNEQIRSAAGLDKK